MTRWFRDPSAQHGIPSVRLRELLPEARFVGCDDLAVSGCSADSRRLEPGELFVALPGRHRDGHDFVAAALARGAAGVLVERLCPEAGPVQVIVPDARAAYGRLCHALAGEPARSLDLIGILGQTDLTATARFLRAIFPGPTGHLGRWDWTDGRQTYPLAGPPDAAAAAGMLAAMTEQRCRTAILEAPTEAFEVLDAVVLTRFEAGDAEPQAVRRAQKHRLERVVPGGVVVVNADDAEAALLGATRLDTRLVMYGLERPAELRGRIERLGPEGTRLRIQGWGQGARIVELSVVGRSLAQSALAAAALAWAKGLDWSRVAAGLEAVERVPGRLEPVRVGQPFPVWLDAGEAARAFEEVQAFTQGTVHLAVDLDRTEVGGRSREHWHRRVFQALASARPGDAVVIVGTGRQRVEGRSAWSDRVVVEAALRRLGFHTHRQTG